MRVLLISKMKHEILEPNQAKYKHGKSNMAVPSN